MGAVHAHACAFDDSIEQAAGCDGNAVGDLNGRGCLSMLESSIHLGGNILVEASSAGDIHGLHAAADGQCRDVVADGQTDQIQFEVRASLGDDRKRVSLSLAVERRVQVWAASRQKQSIDALEEPPPRRTISDERQNHRYPAEFFNGTDVPSPQKICGLFAAPFLTIAGIEVGRDSDDGFHAIGSVPAAAGEVLEGRSRLSPGQVQLRRRGSGSVYHPSNDRE